MFFISSLYLLLFSVLKKNKAWRNKIIFFFIHFPFLFFYTSDFLLKVTCSLLILFFCYLFLQQLKKIGFFFLSVMACKKQQEKKNNLTSTRHFPNSTLIDDKLIRTRNELIAMHAFFFAREKIKRSKTFYFLLLRKKSYSDFTLLSNTFQSNEVNIKKLRHCACAQMCLHTFFCLY